MYAVQDLSQSRMHALNPEKLRARPLSDMNSASARLLPSFAPAFYPRGWQGVQHGVLLEFHRQSANCSSMVESIGTGLKSPNLQHDKIWMLVEPYTYLASVPGKEVRSALVDAFNLWMRVPSEDLAVVKKLVGMLHTASLLMDDVEDDSHLRRGMPVAHKIYGIPQTINSANYVYFLAYQELQRIRPKPGVKVEEMVTEELLHLHRGQGMDLFWRENLICPSEPEYIDMVNNKTGGLFRIAIKLMMAASTENPSRDYVPLANLIGIIFQIRDDYVNLQSAEFSRNKGFCEDLSEGKFSFPIIHSIHSDTTNRQILNILRERPSSPSPKAYAVKYMTEHTNSFEYTRKVLDTLTNQARQEITRLGGNSAVEAILNKLVVTEEENAPKSTGEALKA